MYGILLSSLYSVLTWLVRYILVKFVLFFALYFVTTEFVSVIVSLLPNGTSVTGALGGIASSTWYFLQVFQIEAGISAVVSAYATRFIIRRVPVIG